MAIAAELMAPVLNRVIKDRVHSLHRDPALRDASIFVHAAVQKTAESFYDEVRPLAYKSHLRELAKTRAALAQSVAPPHGLEFSRAEQERILDAKLRETAVLLACVKHMRGDASPTPHLSIQPRGIAFVVAQAVAAVRAQPPAVTRPAPPPRRVFKALRP